MAFIQTPAFQINVTKALHFVADHHVSQKNVKQYRKELRACFDSEEEYQFYMQNYLRKTEHIRLDDFIDTSVNVDCFPVKKSQNDKFFLTDFMEIKYVLHGTATQILDGRTFMLREGTLCIVAPYAQQSTFLWEETDELINIAVRPDKFPVIFPDILKFPNVLQQFYDSFTAQHSAGYLVFEMEPDPIFLTNMQHLLELCMQRRELSAKQDPLRNYYIESIIQMLLLSVISRTANCHSEENDLPDVKLAYIHTFIRKHLSDVTLQTIADEIGYSRSHTGRYIQAMTGKTFSELLQGMRIREAADLLTHSSNSIEEIMDTVGYTGKANFYKLFQQHYHMTPAAYRRQPHS